MGQARGGMASATRLRLCNTEAGIQDVRYLTPHILEAEKEDQERAKWDTIHVERRK